MSRKQTFKQIETRYRKDRQRNLLAKPGPHDFVIVLDHLKASFNVPKILRSAQAFGAAGVQLINIGVFDPAPAKGALRKVPAKFPETFADCYDDLAARGYTLFLMVVDGEASLGQVELPKKSAFIFGHEEFGPSFDPADYPQLKTLKIAQYGEMESLNVSNAASIVMYEYVRQQGVGV
ncbi:MAG: TrmH family RNA methyltransferase [Desulfuromonas sp.]|nr:MAG: TrmH family RNA methyltransferase [Desulfuromonas sp.]